MTGLFLLQETDPLRNRAFSGVVHFLPRVMISSELGSSYNDSELLTAGDE